MLKCTSLRGLLCVVVLVCGPSRIALGQAPYRPHSDLEKATDPAIRPGDNFFAFANGGWLRATMIPAGRERWTGRNEIGETTREQIVRLLDQADSAPAGSLARKVGNFRSALRNETAIEAGGIGPIRASLDSVDHLRDKAALARFLGSGVRADVDPLNWGLYQSAHLLGLSVEPSIHGEKHNVAFLLQGGLGLPDREHYLSQEPQMVALRKSYQEYLVLLLTQAGFEHAAQRATDVVALETAIARTHASREASANDRNADSVWARADFPRRAPGMDWSGFFAAAGLARQDSFVAWQPSAITGMAALLGAQPLAVWQDYLRIRAIDRFAEVLPRAFAEPALTMHAAVSGQSPPGTRAQRAVEVTQGAMNGAIGRLYAERYFPVEQKERIERMVANVVAAFRLRVERARWMSPDTKAVALAKLRTLYFGIGYPRQCEDYSDLPVSATDPVGNLRRVADRNYRLALSRLGRPVEPTQWWIAPQTVGAVLVFQQNAYNFPAALLQAPKFDPDASDAANYGAIGAIVGHEVSHFVDLLGAEWDAGNRLQRWWTAEDMTRFQAEADRLGAQVAAYEPLPGLRINTKLTQTENVADLAGLASAFDAYRGTLGSQAKDAAYVRQQDREFFLGFARSWRSSVTEAGLRTQLASDSHAPDTWRIAIVRNLDAWYDAFDVQPGQRLYLAPSERVQVW